MPTIRQTGNRSISKADDFTGPLTDAYFLKYVGATGKFQLAAVPTPPVTSVAGRTGDVVLTASDVSGVAVLANANTFSKGPQTINSAADGQQCLVAKAASGLPVNLLEVRDYNNVVIGGIGVCSIASAPSLFAGINQPYYPLHFISTATTSATGYISGVYGLVINSTATDSSHYVLQIASGGNANGGGFVTLAGFYADGSAILSPRTATVIPLTIRGVSGQTAKLLVFQGVSSTSTNRNIGVINAGFINSTDASYKGYMSLSAQDYAGVCEGFKVQAADGIPAISFYGHGATTQLAVTGSRGGNAALASLLAALNTTGLIVDSSTA